MSKQGKDVLSNAPMSNCMTELIMGTIKKNVCLFMVGNPSYQPWATKQVLFGYRLHQIVSGVSTLQLMYGAPPGIIPGDSSISP